MAGNASLDHSRQSGRGFTLAELLVAITIFAVLLVVISSMVTQTSKMWRYSMAKIEAFEGTRTAFDLVTRNLSQATLNTYLDYDSPTAPTRYLRQSDLKFVNGAAGAGGYPGTAGTGNAFFFISTASYTLTNSSSSPDYSGMESLLNTCGYYISFSQDTTVPSLFSTAANPYRYRLMQLLVPTESNTIYSSTGITWFTNYTTPGAGNYYAYPVANNIIALIVRPQDPALTPGDLDSRNTNFTPALANAPYAYDSTLNATVNPQPVTANQLPPIVQVTMVALDEVSAKHLENGSTQPSVITTALAGKFNNTGSPNAANYDTDLANLQTALTAAGVRYRVFTSAVPIRESKWTK